jgi:hypothetical protein
MWESERAARKFVLWFMLLMSINTILTFARCFEPDPVIIVIVDVIVVMVSIAGVHMAPGICPR